MAGLLVFARGLLFPRCRPFLKTPDSFFRPACRQLQEHCVHIFADKCTAAEISPQAPNQFYSCMHSLA